MTHLYIFPAIELILSIAVTILLAVRWRKTSDRTTSYWMMAFLFYSLYNIIQLMFVSGIIVIGALSYFLMHFGRQTLVSLMFISVYYGIIQLLSNKKILTQILPITFFALQEVLLAFGDFVAKNIQLADQLHIIFFDVPFNLIIALLFFKLYQVNKKKYSLMISLAWLGYALLVPIFFYTEGGYFLFTLGSLPMVIMFIAFLLFYKAPTGEALIEIQPAIEKQLKTKLRYKLRKGHSYLIEEPKSLKAFNIFIDNIMHGVRGLCITRNEPSWVKACYNLEKTPVLWLTQISEKSSSDVVDPTELEQLLYLIEKFVKKAKMLEENDEEKNGNNGESDNDEEKSEHKSEQKTKINKKGRLIKKSKKHHSHKIRKNSGVKDINDSEYSNKVSEYDKSNESNDSIKIEPICKGGVCKMPPLNANQKAQPIPKVKHSKKSVEQKEDNINSEPVIQKKKGKGGIIIIGEESNDEPKKNKKKKASVKHNTFMVIKGNNKIKSVILLDGVEYLITNNSFEAVKKILLLLKDKISGCDSALLIPIEPNTLSEKEISALRIELYVYEKKF